MPTFIGKPVTVAEDKQLQVGDTLRDFNLTTTDLTKKSLSEFDGKKKVISIVPSIDTGICSTQTRTFNKELSELDDTVVITISVDLPFAQARWCGAEGLENAIMISDYYDNACRFSSRRWQQDYLCRIFGQYQYWSKLWSSSSSG